MQTQLAQLHEKYGQEVLKSEQLETINQENLKVSDSLKTENEALVKKNKQLQENYFVRLDENKKLSATIAEYSAELRNLNLARKGSLPNFAAISNNEQQKHSTEIGFYIACPCSGGETTAHSENFCIYPKISASFQLTLKRNKNRGDDPRIYVTPKVTHMISCNLSVAVSLISKKLTTPVFKSNM